MKIVLVSSVVPLVHGGARFIVEWLEEKLLEHGHEVDRFYLPFVDRPVDIAPQMAAFRLVDLAESCDRLIAFRPPAYAIPHPNKVLWFIHHIRTYYDLWDGPYAPQPEGGEDIPAIRAALMAFDNQALGEARKIFTNSRVVSERLARFNGLASEVLYPPILGPERFTNAGYGDQIAYCSRLEPHKRQQLLIEAMAHVKTPVKLRLCGRATSPEHARMLQAEIGGLGVAERVIFEDRWISEDEKAEILAGALATAYVPADEDSYGYPSLESSHAEKAIVTTTDSGGVLELVEDGVNGFVRPPDPAALAEVFDRLWTDRRLAERLGRGARQRLADLKIDWNHVVERLTA
jgi:glycosyltransferase involved in cell wall biosynthesis